MILETWEEEALKELENLQKGFYNRLSELGEKCYKLDANKFCTDFANKLSMSQVKDIYAYWNKFVNNIDTSYHCFYTYATGIFDVRYIPDNIFAGYIDGYLNNREIEPAFADKNYMDLYLRDFKTPETYIHLINGVFEDRDYKIISKEEAIKILLNKKSFVVKPSMASYGGKEVFVFKKISPVDLINFVNTISNENLIFQELISQNSMTALLHPESLNTIRIMTLKTQNSIEILHCVFRIGRDKMYVDNAAQGGIFCKINEDGTLANIAYDGNGNTYKKHPNGGTFDQVQIQNIERAKSTVKKAAQRFPHFRLIGWDIAIDKMNEPVIIEANLTMSSIDLVQLTCGPLFGKYTEDILGEVFLYPKKKLACRDLLQYI